MKRGGVTAHQRTLVEQRVRALDEWQERVEDFGLEANGQAFRPEEPVRAGVETKPFSANLDEGSVLIAGGFGGTFFQVYRRSAVIYDPRTNTWRGTRPMQFRRYFGAWSARLPGREGILFAGAGLTDDLELHDVTGEVFHPESNTWTLAPTAGGPPPDGSIDSFESQLVQLGTGRLQTTGGADAATDTLGTGGSWIFGEVKR